MKLRLSGDFRVARAASPLGNGGRGLKPAHISECYQPAGIAPRQRGAWIETADRQN